MVDLYDSGNMSTEEMMMRVAMGDKYGREGRDRETAAKRIEQGAMDPGTAINNAPSWYMSAWDRYTNPDWSNQHESDSVRRWRGMFEGGGEGAQLGGFGGMYGRIIGGVLGAIIGYYTAPQED